MKITNTSKAIIVLPFVGELKAGASLEVNAENLKSLEKINAFIALVASGDLKQDDGSEKDAAPVAPTAPAKAK